MSNINLILEIIPSYKWRLKNPTFTAFYYLYDLIKFFLSVLRSAHSSFFNPAPILMKNSAYRLLAFSGGQIPYEVTRPGQEANHKEVEEETDEQHAPPLPHRARRPQAVSRGKVLLQLLNKHLSLLILHVQYTFCHI